RNSRLRNRHISIWCYIDFYSRAGLCQFQQPGGSVDEYRQRDHREQIRTGFFETEPFEVEGELKSQPADADQTQHHGCPYIALELEERVGHPVAPCEWRGHDGETGQARRAANGLETPQRKIVYCFAK